MVLHRWKRFYFPEEFHAYLPIHEHPVDRQLVAIADRGIGRTALRWASALEDDAGIREDFRQARRHHLRLGASSFENPAGPLLPPIGPQALEYFAAFMVEDSEADRARRPVGFGGGADRGGGVGGLNLDFGHN